MDGSDELNAGLLAAIEWDRVRIEGGGLALMSAMANLAKSGIAPPGWLADEFWRRVRRLQWLDAETWDEALGPPFPKYFHAATTRKRRRVVEPRVQKAITDLLLKTPRMAIDKVFWSEVAIRSGTSATVAEEIYQGGRRSGYATIQEQRAELAIYSAASHLLPGPTPLPFDEDVRVWIAAITGLSLTVVEAWHEREVNWSARYGGEWLFEPDVDGLPLGKV